MCPRAARRGPAYPQRPLAAAACPGHARVVSPAQLPIYLDYNATTPIREAVVEAMLPYLTQHFGNPSSGHIYGERTQRAVHHARQQVAELLGAQSDEIVFTSGGTEASNLAIRGWIEATDGPQHIVTSVIEHPATRAPCDWLAAHGHVVEPISVDSGGQISMDEAAALIQARTGLVTVMHANNETGALQPISELSRLAKKAKAILHTDAAQSLGKVPVHVDTLGVDLLTVAGHKLYAPKGVGALYVRRGTRLSPFALGAGHEGGMRPGTENVASIVGLGRACELAREELEQNASHMQTLRDELWARLSANINGLQQNGTTQDRLPNTLNLRFPGVSGRALIELAPEIAASTGSACHEGGEQASAVILAMGIDPEQALGSVRLSLGHETTATQVQAAAEALLRAYSRLTSPPA